MKQRIFTLAISTGVFLAAINLRAQDSAPTASPTTSATNNSVQNGSATNASPSNATSGIADAAKVFLATLDNNQREKVVYNFKDDAQRKRWSNFPSPIFQRGGLRMGDLTSTQRNAVMSLLKVALSKQGYEKVIQIIEGDEVLKKTDTGRPG